MLHEIHKNVCLNKMMNKVKVYAIRMYNKTMLHILKVSMQVFTVFVLFLVL